MPGSPSWRLFPALHCCEMTVPSLQPDGIHRAAARKEQLLVPVRATVLLGASLSPRL